MINKDLPPPPALELRSLAIKAVCLLGGCLLIAVALCAALAW